MSESRKHKPRHEAARSRQALAGALLLLGAGLAGCAQAPSKPASPDEPPLASIQRQPALALLSYARHLTETTPEGREAAVRAARQEMRDKSDALSYAHLALALAAPRQRLYTPDEAARYAGLALAADDAPWDANARQYLSDMQRLLTMATERDQDAEQRIATLESKLAAAREKLSALSDIENRLDNPTEAP